MSMDDDDRVAGNTASLAGRRLTLEESKAQRAASAWDLAGSTPDIRRMSAEILVKLDRRFGKVTPQWVLDVYEGRLPA